MLPVKSAADRAEPAAALDRALRDVSARSVLFSQAVADRLAMNPTDLEALDLLARYGPMTAGRLAEVTGLTTGAVTGLVDRLEGRGFVRREPHPTDRRSIVIHPLVEEAERVIGPAYVGMSQAMAELLMHYNDEELLVILDFLTRADAITGEQIAKLRSESALEG